MKPTIALCLLAFLAFLLGELGCGSTSSPPLGACTEGETRVCVGPAACMGGQRCAGAAWGECDCGAGGSSAFAVASGGGMGGAGGTSSSTSTPAVLSAATGGGGDAGGCPLYLADCNGDPADGCEIDLATDNKNCGNCGFDCMGDKCNQLVCGPMKAAK